MTLQFTNSTTVDFHQRQNHKQEQNLPPTQPQPLPERIRHSPNSSPSIEQHMEHQLDQDLSGPTHALDVGSPQRIKDQRVARHRLRQISKPSDSDNMHPQLLASTPVPSNSKGQKASTDLFTSLCQVQDPIDLLVSPIPP